MWKRILYLVIGLIIIISMCVVPSAMHTVDDEITIIYMSDTPIISTTRSSNGFDEGRPVELQFYIEYCQYGEIVREYVSVLAKCEYIDAPGTGYNVEAYKIMQEFDFWVINGMNDLFASEYPNAERQRDASSYYNCHSYAWHSTSESNYYWINTPDAFYFNNDHYIEVSDPAVGDIICYYNAGNINLHSGIVIAVNGQISNEECGNSNTVEVISKWGAYGLYEHNGYECPYTSYSDGGQATYVKYYRQVHNYSYMNITTNYQHRATCRTCGYTFVETHSWKILLDGSQKCLKCGVTTTGHVILSVEEHDEHE